MTTADRSERAEILRSCGAPCDVVDELLTYADGGFPAADVAADREYPLPDEPLVAAWEQYAEEASHAGVAATLRRHLVQLRFPIEPGMSERDTYRVATRRGVLPPDTETQRQLFADETGLAIVLHPTPAGRLPVIIADARADFELLVRALSHRNEPVSIPRSMGACIVGGYNDWSRVARLRADWTQRCPDQALGPGAGAAWQREFQRLMPQRELYQDRFVILSTGPYSATPAHSLGLTDEEWRRMSLVIRLEHECAHYFTKRVFGSMRNSLLDELIADYTGIVAARGRFEPDWLLRFMGAEHPTEWRPDGRLLNYRGNPPLSDAAFVVLQMMVRRAACTLDRFDALVRGSSHARPHPRSLADVAHAIGAIAQVGLERMTAPGAEVLLYATFVRQQARRDPDAGRDGYAASVGHVSERTPAAVACAPCL
jgi:hypothetical protein